MSRRSAEGAHRSCGPQLHSSHPELELSPDGHAPPAKRRAFGAGAWAKPGQQAKPAPSAELANLQGSDPAIPALGRSSKRADKAAANQILNPPCSTGHGDAGRGALPPPGPRDMQHKTHGPLQCQPQQHSMKPQHHANTGSRSFPQSIGDGRDPAAQQGGHAMTHGSFPGQHANPMWRVQHPPANPMHIPQLQLGQLHAGYCNSQGHHGYQLHGRQHYGDRPHAQQQAGYHHGHLPKAQQHAEPWQLGQQGSDPRVQLVWGHGGLSSGKSAPQHQHHQQPHSAEPCQGYSTAPWPRQQQVQGIPCSQSQTAEHYISQSLYNSNLHSDVPAAGGNGQTHWAVQGDQFAQKPRQQHGHGHGHGQGRGSGQAYHKQHNKQQQHNAEWWAQEPVLRKLFADPKSQQPYDANGGDAAAADKDEGTKQAAKRTKDKKCSSGVGPAAAGSAPSGDTDGADVSKQEPGVQLDHASLGVLTPRDVDPRPILLFDVSVC